MESNFKARKQTAHILLSLVFTIFKTRGSIQVKYRYINLLCLRAPTFDVQK
jgi:hypothetical protein